MPGGSMQSSTLPPGMTPPGDLALATRLHRIRPAYGIGSHRPAQAGHRSPCRNGVPQRIPMFGGELARVAEIERDDQRIPVTQRVGRTEIVAREQHVVASGEVGIDAQVNNCEARICIDDDAAVLLPPSRLLRALRVA